LDLDKIKINQNNEDEIIYMNNKIIKNKKLLNIYPNSDNENLKQKTIKKNLNNIDNNVEYYETKSGHFHKVLSKKIYEEDFNEKIKNNINEVNFENFNINQTKNKLIKLENILKNKNNRSNSSKRKNKNKKIILNNLFSNQIISKDNHIDKLIISKDKNTNNIEISYKILNSIDTSIIIYDGEIYKIQKNKINVFKLISRYFQITKNSFKYFSNAYSSQVYNDKPLLQFDIRQISNIEIIDITSLELKEKYSNYFCFIINLTNKNDIFGFATINKEYGENIIQILNLLRNYYKNKGSY
jgi:hypothetical protein